MENEEVLRSIACIITIDGTIAQQEQQFWERLCNRLGISKEEATAVLLQAQNENGRIHIPETHAKKTLLFTLLVPGLFNVFFAMVQHVGRRANDHVVPPPKKNSNSVLPPVLLLREPQNVVT